MATTMGPIGMVFKGAYDAAVEYQLLNVVTDGGNSYVYKALTPGSGKPLPVAPAVTTEYWAAIALKGEAVEMQLSGGYVQYRREGSDDAWANLLDAADITPTFAVGTVTTGAAGSAAAVEDVGEPGAPVLNFTIPKGDGIADGSVARSMLAADVEPMIPKGQKLYEGDAYVIVDENDRVALRVREDGTVEVPKLKVAQTGVHEDATVRDAVAYAVADADGRKSEMTIDGAGRVPDWVLTRWGERLADRARVRRIVCWGDSLTAGAGGAGTTWPGVLQSLAPNGWTVENYGVGGESSNTIAARQGGQVMMVDDVTIPAEKTAVQIAGADGIPTNIGKYAKPCIQGNAGVNPCVVAGVSGSLSASGGLWYFTRAVAGEAVAIDRPTPILTNAATNKRGGVAVLWVSANGGWDSDPEALVSQLRQMIDFGRYDDYLVLGRTGGTAESQAALESAMLDAFGRRFVNLREYLSAYGLTDAGLTPTAGDETAMANGTVPGSLKTDGVHFKAAGYTVIGNYVYKRLIELDMLDEGVTSDDIGGETNMAIITRLNEAFTDTSLPKLTFYDPIESKEGSLALIDFSHPMNPMTDTPINSSAIPNILKAYSTDIVGTAYDFTNVTVTDDHSLIEVTPKGGLHVIRAQSTDYSVEWPEGGYSKIPYPQALFDYIVANGDHRYYISLWCNVTRKAGQGRSLPRCLSAVMGYQSGTRKYLLRLGELDSFFEYGAGVTEGATGNRLICVATDDTMLGTPGAAHSNILMHGALGTTNTYTTNEYALESIIFYRAYVEDLTASGRTYAEVEAIDQALYTKEVLTEGGRYYGDTWTEPETVDA